MSDVNYEAVDIPDDKPPSEYHWTERRWGILQLIETAGHPDSISPTRLADLMWVRMGNTYLSVGTLR